MRPAPPVLRLAATSPAPATAVPQGAGVQRSGFGQVLDYFADKANNIPGFRMLTVILGFNPISMSRVERNAANILRALIEFMPGGALVTQALDNHGLLARVAAWVEQQLGSLATIGGAIGQAISTFLDTLGWRDLFDLSGVWNRATRIFTEPIGRLVDFAKSVAIDILKFIKSAILLPLARLAEGTKGYDLLKAVLGEDPVTGDPVPRNAETLIGGFMKLIGQEEIWENTKKAKAIPRAWAWFQGALEGLLGFVRQIPPMVIAALQALTIADVVLVPRAFLKVANVFGGFVVRFLVWAGGTVWNLLEIIFDVVSPAALRYIKKTGAALKSILKNPLPFVGNLVKAAKLGFQNFADHFGEHLKAGLIDWLTGSLPGVYIPKAFELGEIVKFVFSVLGLSWKNVRGKLVKVVGETAVKAMEVGFDIVVTLVTEGPAAAWEKIKDELSKLKDMAIGAITDFVVDTIVKKAVPKLVSMFIPGAGFISAIISIYDTIMVFVEKISKIIQVVTGFIDSIVNIAAGVIDAAAKKVESTLANLLSLAISFLAGFLGLGKIADKIMGVIKKLQAMVDKGLDALIAWIVKMAKKLFAKVFGKKEENSKEHDEAVKAGLAAITAAEAPLRKDGKITLKDATEIAGRVKTAHPIFKSLKAKAQGGKVGYLYKASGELEFVGAPLVDGYITVLTVKITDPGKAEKVRAAVEMSGNEFESAVQSVVVKEGIVPLWAEEFGDPIDIAVKGTAKFNRESRQDQPLLKIQKGHRDATGRKRSPDATLEKKERSLGGPIEEVRVIEITLVEDFTKESNQFSLHKATQIYETLSLFKEKYGDAIPVKYFFFCPRELAQGTRDLIKKSIDNIGMKNVEITWTILASSKVGTT